MKILYNQTFLSFFVTNAPIVPVIININATPHKININNLNIELAKHRIIEINKTREVRHNSIRLASVIYSRYSIGNTKVMNYHKKISLTLARFF